MFRFERELCPRNRFLGEVSEGAAEAPSDETPQMGPYHRSSVQPVTMFTSLPGTTMTLRIVLPAMDALTLIAARAAVSAACSSASAGTVMRLRSLPITCTAIWIWASDARPSSHRGQ